MVVFTNAEIIGMAMDPHRSARVVSQVERVLAQDGQVLLIQSMLVETGVEPQPVRFAGCAVRCQ